MAFILVRAPPPMPGAPRPRFSLYLSAQLQYGVVLVYSRQCQYLVEEIQHILERLNRTEQQFRIDLTDLEKPGLLLPNQLDLMEALEEAPDPFFGLMKPLLPSPVYIPHVRRLLEAPTPPESSPPEHPPSSLHRRAGEPLTASPEAITLKEAEPITLLKIEDERDLPEVTAQEIEMLAEQEGFLVPGVEGAPPLPSKRPLAEELSEEEERVQEPFAAFRLSPPTRIGEESLAPRETGLLLTDELQLPGEAPLLPLEATPPSEGPRLLLPPSSSPPGTPRHLDRPPSSPELLLPAFEPSPARPRRRRRQLCFLDEVTQISRDDFQEQITNTHAQCQPLELVLLPAKRQRTPSELLGNPTYGWMHPTLHGLWARCANLQRVDYARQRASEERARKAEEEAAPRAEVPSELEELMAVEEPSLPPPVSSEISLEATEEEQHPSLVLSEERTLLEPEEGALPVLPELPEISLDVPPDKDAITLDYIRRLISAKLEQFGEIEFDQLVPPLTTPRPVVSRLFSMCLVLSGAQFVRLEQRQPYGQILLQPGARFHLS